MVELVICLHCLKALHGAMISFVCILLTFIDYGQPDLILFNHGWIVDGNYWCSCCWLFMLLSWSSQKTLICWTTLQTIFLPWATIKILTENDVRKAELEENFPKIEPPVGALRIVKITLEQKTENISTAGLFFVWCNMHRESTHCIIYRSIFSKQGRCFEKCPTLDTVSFLDADNAILV